MLDRSRSLGLTLKTANRFAFLQVFAAEDVRPYGFNRHSFGREFGVFCQIYLAHSTTAQTALEQIAPCQQLGSRQRRSSRCSVIGTRRYVILITPLAFWTFPHRLTTIFNSKPQTCKETKERTPQTRGICECPSRL